MVNKVLIFIALGFIAGVAGGLAGGTNWGIIGLLIVLAVG